MKRFIIGACISLLAISSHADGKINQWDYTYSKSDFLDDTTNAVIATDETKTMFGRTTQGILSISYSVNDREKTDPKLRIMLNNAITDSCDTTCPTLVNIDGEKISGITMSEITRHAYEFHKPKEVIDLIKDAKVIKFGMLLFPDDMVTYTFKPKSSLDLSKLPTEEK